MKTAYSLITLAALLGTTVHADTVFFNSPDDQNLFNIRFSNNISSEPADYLATGGLSDSGWVQMDNTYQHQAWIAKTGLSITPGATYTVSAYINTSSYAGIGFTFSSSDNSPTLYPTHSILSGINSASGYIDLNNSGSDGSADLGFWDTTGDLQNTILSPENYAIGDWVFLSLSITNEGDSYLAHYSAQLSDSSGVLQGMIADGSQIFDNPELLGGDALYPFFYFDGDQLNPGIDNFTAAVPEPAAAAGLAGLIALSIACLRRRLGRRA
jgi:hypothetical protein